MNIYKPDYRQFRLKKLNTDEFKHVKLLLFWPLFGIMFSYVERFSSGVTYYPMHCAFDDVIPFCEWFLIPYLFWFVYLIGTLVYTFFFDVPAFRRMMHFIICTYTITMIIYLIFPTCQNLRPTVFPRDNALTDFVKWFYTFDTNTNVCPSIHVIGSVAAMFGLLDCHDGRLQKTWFKILVVFLAVLISASTVFMKQHSILDVIAAVPLCVLGHYVAYRLADEPSRVSAKKSKV